VPNANNLNDNRLQFVILIYIELIRVIDTVYRLEQCRSNNNSAHNFEKMRIVITGAAGFIGQIVTRELLSEESNFVLLTDVVEPTIPQSSKYPQNAKLLKANLNQSGVAIDIANTGFDAAILLHGIMSSGAEANLELGYEVNVDATREIIEQLSMINHDIKIVYASSEAVYGRPVPKKGVTEEDVPHPEMSYGCQKLICETFINDYTRRGLINGISLRFPTISIRPGKPTAAITSFLSGIIREPLNGEICTLPLEDRNWRHWMSSPKTIVHNIMVALKLPRDALPSHRRAVNAPGFAVTIQDMLDALEEVGGKEKLALVKEDPIPDMQSVLYSWADDFDNSLALSLGMKQDSSFNQSVRDYIETMNS
jgi:nucleoside-diphosphate-sugar epimerase